MTDDDRQTAGHEDDVAPDDSSDDADVESETAHLAGVKDGCGCAEVWEHLSERREAE